MKEIAWWSVYEIGQRLCDKFDDVPEEAVKERLPRVFIAGDACHTHSPKAGQGMNVSMQDGFNLGWKLASVLRKRCAPRLLHTYSAERQAVAKELIDFDREWAALLASSKGFDPAETQNYFVRHGRYTAGTATRYHPSIHHRRADLSASGRGRSRSACVSIPRRSSASRTRSLFTSATPSRRTAAGASSHLPERRIQPRPIRASAACANFLSEARESPVRKYTPAGEDIDSVIDVRAVFQQGHQELDIKSMPSFLLPPKGRYGLRDYEKIFCPDLKSGQDIFAMRGIDRERGCMVVVRPDQFVAHVLPLDGYSELAAFFDGFMMPVAERATAVAAE